MACRKSPDESISVQALQHVSDHSYGHGHCIYGGQRIHGGTGIQLAGISKYGANAMITKDLNSVCAVVLVIGATFLVVNLIVDVINAMVDPRIRLGGDL